MTDAADEFPKADGAMRARGREPRVVLKRFYSVVTVVPMVEAGFAIHLDGRAVRTPRKANLVVDNQALADAIAAEWAAQGAEIRPSTMPLTTLACTAIDAVTQRRAEVAAEIGAYATSDLLCYRAEAPEALAALQAENWNPVLGWANAELGVPFTTATGVMPVAQAPAISVAVVAAIAPLAPLPLAALHVLTTLTGSAVLGLAVLRRHLDLADAWRLAHLDEDWQAERWGRDAEAEARHAARWKTAVAAGTILEHS